MGEKFHIEFLFEEIKQELRRADLKHGRFSGPREGVGRIRCELEELHTEVVAEESQPGDDRMEAIQVATTAIKYIRDCCSGL